MINNLSELIIIIPVLLFSLTIHEYSHGKAAFSLGDPTAKNAGRLTMNPISHIDPIGAICLFLFHFGWAKPVPVDTRYFKNPKRDIIIMALSGPISNFAAAMTASLFYRFLPLEIAFYKLLLIYLILFNVALGLFNLLPIPPLDGSHVMENLLPRNAAFRYRQIGRHAPFILIGILLADRFLHLDILGKVLNYPISFIVGLLIGS